MGISQQMYSQIEKNPEKTTLKRLKDLADALQVNLNTLLNEDESFLQQNFNQQGGNTASQMNFHSSKEAYKLLIEKMENEVAFLREVLRTNRLDKKSL